MSDRFSDERVAQMHPRQAEILLQVPAQDRDALYSHAWFRQSVSGYIFSQALQLALEIYRAKGADGLREETRTSNAKLMGWS